MRASLIYISIAFTLFIQLDNDNDNYGDDGNDDREQSHHMKMPRMKWMRLTKVYERGGLGCGKTEHILYTWRKQWINFYGRNVDMVYWFSHLYHLAICYRFESFLLRKSFVARLSFDRDTVLLRAAFFHFLCLRDMLECFFFSRTHTHTSASIQRIIHAHIFYYNKNNRSAHLQRARKTGKIERKSLGICTIKLQSFYFIIIISKY